MLRTCRNLHLPVFYWMHTNQRFFYKLEREYGSQQIKALRLASLHCTTNNLNSRTTTNWLLLPTKYPHLIPQFYSTVGFSLYPHRRITLFSMGKGGGCVPSKKKNPRPLAISEHDPLTPPAPIPISDQVTYHNDAVAAAADETITTTLSQPRELRKLKIFIVFYSMYGHVQGLAKRMKKGVDGVDGVEGVLYRVPETLTREALEHMKVPPSDEEIPEISAAELVEADGFLFGFPTRYGCMAAQMKAFFDSTGLLWKEGKLVGKPAGFFVSTGTQGGGQETTAWTAITQLAHHGMLFVPIGYTFGAGMFKMDSIRGGSPYGAGVFAGDGTREPSETELALSEHQGKYMAAVVKKLCQA